MLFGQTGEIEGPVAEVGEEKAPAQTHFRGAQPIALSQIVIAAKQSKLEYDMMTRGLSFDELQVAYEQEGVDLDRVVTSHQRQAHALETLRTNFAPHQIVTVSNDDTELALGIQGAKLVVSFGGDNHFQRISHLVSGNTPMLGINSDPESSYGALLYYTTDRFLASLQDIELGRYTFEPWTRIAAEIDGKLIGVATCDVFLGENRRQMMSRYRLTLSDQKAEHKSSGLIVSTGAGSRGWFNSAIRPFFPEGLQFPKTERFLRFVSSEISITGNINMPYGTVNEDSPLVVESLNDDDGIVSLDSLESFPFPRGKRAKLIVDSNPFWVIAPERELR